MFDETNEQPADEENLTEIETSVENQAIAPDGLPQKFWDENTGAVRIEAMIKSYGDLERKLGAGSVLDIPDGPDDYDIQIAESPIEADADVNARLHQAGFTRDQANLVYQLANEKLMPMLADMAQDYEVEAQIEHLQDHFGGVEKWQETSRQLKAWGQANLSSEVFEALTATREGVLTLHRMMKTGEPQIGPRTGSRNGDGDQSVKELMNNPRYWRDRDPAMVEKVRQGFRELYPEQ